MNRVRMNSISLDLFSDKTPWLADGYKYGKEAKLSQSVKSLLQKVIATELTPLQRDVITQVYYGGKTVTEIALERGVNKSSVSRCLKCGRERIGQALKYGSYRLWDES